MTNKTSSSQRSSLSISSHDSKEGVVENRPNHRKKFHAPKPPIQQPKTVDENNLNNLAETTSNLEIRAPSELLLGFPTGLRQQWRHSAEVLITSAVKYEVNVRIQFYLKHFIYVFHIKKQNLKIIIFPVSWINGDKGVTWH